MSSPEASFELIIPRVIHTVSTMNLYGSISLYVPSPCDINKEPALAEMFTPRFDDNARYYSLKFSDIIRAEIRIVWHSPPNSYEPSRYRLIELLFSQTSARLAPRAPWVPALKNDSMRLGALRRRLDESLAPPPSLVTCGTTVLAMQWLEYWHHEPREAFYRVRRHRGALVKRNFAALRQRVALSVGINSQANLDVRLFQPLGDLRCSLQLRSNQFDRASFPPATLSPPLDNSTSSLCPNGHALKCFSAPDVLITWYCDGCNVGRDARDARWGRPNFETRFVCAQGCNFDLCRACASTPQPPPPTVNSGAAADGAAAELADDEGAEDVAEPADTSRGLATSSPASAVTDSARQPPPPTSSSALPSFMPLPRLNVDSSRYRWQVTTVDGIVVYAKYSEAIWPLVLYRGDLLAQLIRTRRTTMWALSMLRAHIDECVEAAGELHARQKPLAHQSPPLAQQLADGVGVQSGPSAAVLNHPTLTAALRRFICVDVVNAVVETAINSFSDGNAWAFATCATTLLTMVCLSDPIRTVLQKECDLFGCTNRLLRTTDAACRAAPDAELKAEMHDYAVSALCHALKFFYKSPAGQAELMSSGVADTLVALLAAPSSRSVRLSCLDMLMKFDMRLHRSLLAVDGLLPRLAELVSCDDRAVQTKAVTLAHSIDAAEHTVGADRHALLSHIVDALTAVGRTGGEPLLRCLRLCRHLARHNERLVKLGLLARIAELIDRWCAHAPTMQLVLAVLRAYALGLDAQPSAEEQLALARATGDTGAAPRPRLSALRRTMCYTTPTHSTRRRHCRSIAPPPTRRCSWRRRITTLARTPRSCRRPVRCSGSCGRRRRRRGRLPVRRRARTSSAATTCCARSASPRRQRVPSDSRRGARRSKRTRPPSSCSSRCSATIRRSPRDFGAIGANRTRTSSTKPSTAAAPMPPPTSTLRSLPPPLVASAAKARRPRPRRRPQRPPRPPPRPPPRQRLCSR
jgi:hypothetical protein